MTAPTYYETARVFGSPSLLPSASSWRGWPPDAGVLADGLTGEEAGKPRALVVDDAPDVTEMVATMMRYYAGFDVVTAFSGAAALEAARGARFDVVISDIGMPGMNGYELAGALRELPGYEGVPLIAVTGFSMYDDRERALRSGFNDFLTKPISPADLLQAVQRLRD